jgi:hypothetical protein
MKTLTAACVISLGLATPLAADGFNRAHVPASARAVAHLDVEALLRSELVNELQKLDPQFALDFDMGEHHPMLKGFKPLQDVRSITVFSSDLGKQRLGALVRVDAKIETLLQIATAFDPYESFEVDGQPVHSWSEGDDQRVFACVRPISGSSDRLVLVTNDAGLLGSGLAALSSQAASLAGGGQGVLAANAQPGAILFAVSDQPLTQLGEIDANSSVARLVQGAVVQAGEQGGSVFGSVSLITEKPQDALRLSQVLQGFTALAGLVGENAEEAQALQRLVSGLSFQANGSQLFVEFRYDLSALMREMQSLEHDYR